MDAPKTPAAPSGSRHRYLAALGALLLLLLAHGLYGAGGPFVWGHYGFHAGEYSTRARHTIRHHTIMPSNAPGWTQPDNPSYYLHHPILTHQLVTVSLLILGQREVAVRAAALFSTVIAYLLLVTLLWRYYGRWQAVLGGAMFVLVPVHVWFAAHMDPGMPGIACVLGMFLCYFRFAETGSLRAAVGAAALLSLAGLFEWSPFLAAFPIFLHALIKARHQPGRPRLFVALFVLGGLLPLALHAGIVIGYKHIPEMRESYMIRSGGPSFWRALQGVCLGGLEMYGAPVLVAMALWLLLLLKRAWQKELRLRDLLPVGFAFAIVVYSALLRNAVLVHLYRLLYGGSLAAFAAVEVTEALYAALEGRTRFRASVCAAVALSLVVGTAICGGYALLESRRTGGVPMSTKYDPEMVPRAFIQRVMSLTAPTDRVFVLSGLILRKDVYFDFDRDLVPVPSISWVNIQPSNERVHAVLVLLEPLHGWLEQQQLTAMKRRFPSWQIGPYTLVDLRNPNPADPKHVYHEHLLPPPPRSLLLRYWQGPYAPPLLAPDPPQLPR
jgi:hypothetical protein